MFFFPLFSFSLCFSLIPGALSSLDRSSGPARAQSIVYFNDSLINYGHEPRWPVLVGGVFAAATAAAVASVSNFPSLFFSFTLTL